RAQPGLVRAAETRAGRAVTPPSGWVHSEFHPESVFVGDNGVYLHDFARAFHGPGLLDLASWSGTVGPPDPDRTRAFLEAYVHAGGARQALARRGGLEAQDRSEKRRVGRARGASWAATHHV